jgi:nitrogen fixation NifU-like protein
MILDDLYREVILDHYRAPRNAARPEELSGEQVHENPTCGDSLRLEVVLAADGTVQRIRHHSQGCAISVASASLMTEALRGQSVAESREIASRFIRAMRGEDLPGSLEELGELAALQGVTRFPLRVKCATLAWHALLGALPRASPSPSGP